ncbi:hypothetical protein DM01DRAFT_1311806 [Hesseltinella vesiculosa]|uniref:Swiss Army Knife 2H phosphoesterase domain-containing protein n=1 Tax=Hesseltinella vesiculosa TaxID=101127 RepID=A0A1X2G5E2_9FUNG|nr:hypothetical protein DM01DRAFT_1311806 [Hesseltinella vesiculosa]
MLSSLSLIAFLIWIASCQQIPIYSGQKTPLGVPWQGDAIAVSKAIYDTDILPFTDHSHEDPPWLGLSLDYKHVHPILEQLNSSDAPLLSRQEAHITVITPPEYTVLSQAEVTMDQINAIALENDIQSCPFELICIGRVHDKGDDVYDLIVIPGESLLHIREDVFRLYVSQGGNPSYFDPQMFRPHVTVGFTKTDLFDGVYKGINTCHRPIKLI